MQRAFRSILILSAVILLPIGIFAQIPPLRLPPLQVPTGTGTCSVEKSCVDLAPAMIQSALGPSPLEENLRYLTDTVGGRVTGSPAADRAVGWAVEALHHAGVDEVHTEKFTVPVPSLSPSTWFPSDGPPPRHRVESQRI
ncbi:MAG: hypothetical protein ABSB66_17050 [Candidatus Acidiferrales bacterium]